MATGTYSIARNADVDITDIEVLVHYTNSRSSTGDITFTKLNSTDVLSKMDNPDKTGISFEGLPGVYQLKLPTTTFNAVGIYTIILRPVEIRTRVVDCGVLSSNPTVRGLVLDISTIDSNFQSKFENDGLVGYRIEYLSDTNTTDKKIPNLFRLVTSNNRCEPVNQNLTNSSQKAIRYRLNNNSSLTYLTVTPQSASNVAPNVIPFIGNPNQEIIITNTFFNTTMIEVELVNHDIETLAFGIFGNKSKSLEDGILTEYNFNNQIYKQYNLFEIKDKFTGKPLFEVKEERSNIDFTKGFNDITNV